MPRLTSTTIGRRAVLGGAAALAGCAQAVPAPALSPRLSADRSAYVYVQARIGGRMRDTFVRGVEAMLALDPARLVILMSSPGGEIGATQDLIAFLEDVQRVRRIPVTTHNTGVVASAACYVFLTGQRRLSVANGAFLFHEVSLTSTGPIPSGRLQEESAKVQQVEASFLRMLRARTRLTEGEAASFVRRTVILSADEARRDGIIEAVSPISIPPEAVVFAIRSVAPPGAAARAPEPG